MNLETPIPTHVVEHLRCALCQNYLSVPPIMIITDDGEQQKCGRCKITHEMNLRNHLYEKIVRLHSFPCIYPKCTTNIRWGSVKDHEMLCPDRTISCVVRQCKKIIELSEYPFHCLTEHPQVTCSSRLVYRDKGFDSRHLGILIKNNVPLLVYINVETEDFWISMYSTHPHLTKNWKFNISLSSGTIGEPFIFYENQEIVPYDEREHCLECLYFDCQLKHHPYSKLYKTEAQCVKTTIINSQKAKSVLDTTQFTFVIDVVNDTNNRILKNNLQCPVCLERMEKRIFACIKGHPICNSCRPKVNICPTCRLPIKDTRLFLLEEIAQNYEIHCQYETQGCNFMDNIEKVAQHEERCRYRP